MKMRNSKFTGSFVAALAIYGAPAISMAAQVTTAPPDAAAPAMSGIAFGLLAVGLLAVAGVSLRRRGTAAGLAAVAALAVAGAVVVQAATTTLKIAGDACFQRVTREYESGTYTELLNLCQGPIQVVAVDPECGPDNTTEVLNELPAQLCQPGIILESEDFCALPGCI